jgi:hypothetical protein
VRAEQERAAALASELEQPLTAGVLELEQIGATRPQEHVVERADVARVHRQREEESHEAPRKSNTD